MKAIEFKNLTIKELQSLLDEKRTALAKHKIDLKLGRVVTVNVMKELKKDVARVITELNARRLNK